MKPCFYFFMEGFPQHHCIETREWCAAYLWAARRAKGNLGKPLFRVSRLARGTYRVSRACGSTAAILRAAWRESAKPSQC